MSNKKPKREGGIVRLSRDVQNLKRDFGTLQNVLGQLFERYHDELKLAGVLVELLAKQALGEELTDDERAALTEFVTLRKADEQQQPECNVQSGEGQPEPTTGGEEQDERGEA